MGSAPGAAQAVLQPVAGPEASPLRRMDCPVDGTIRGDDGFCVDVEAYFSTATNTVYWVSQTVGSDANPGTKVRPWKTISRAAGVLGPGDAVVIRGGTYRETIAPHESGRAGQLITFAAYPGESVVVSGADPLNDGWTASGDSWRHDWTLPLPGVPNKGTVAERPEFRRELVVVDGQVLTPVFARDELVPGTFFVE